MNLAFRVVIAVVLAVLAAALWWISASRSPQVPAPVSLRLAAITSPASAALYIAEREGLFARHGLAPELQEVAYGKLGLEQILARKSDIALVAETPIVLAALRHQEPLAILASIYQSNNEYQIIARKDRGIATPGDLRGKRIGYFPATNMQYVAEAYLLTHGIPYDPQQYIAITLDDTVVALLEDRVDAVAVFPPFNFYAVKALGQNAVKLRPSSIFPFNFCLVSTRAWAQANPETVQKLLATFTAASSTIHERPQETLSLLATALKLDPDTIAASWEPKGHFVNLGPELLMTLESLQQWALRRDLVPGAKAVEVRNMLWFDGLKQINPQAITIHH